MLGRNIEFVTAMPAKGDTQQIGLGLYASNVFLGIFIEVVFIVAALWFYFSREAAAGAKPTPKNRAAIIGVFVFAILFMLTIATTSVRQWVGLAEFDLGFNTSVPMLLLTYGALMWVLLRAVLLTTKPERGSKGGGWLPPQEASP